MLDWYAAWSGFGPETKGALIGATATAVTGLLGFGAVLWQIASQGRANRDGVAENERRRLKAQLYEETVAVCATVSNKVTAFSSTTRLLGQLIEIAAAAKEVRMHPQVPGIRFPEILQAQGEMVDAAIEFVFVIERRQIVDPRIMIFRTAMNVALHDFSEVFNREFVPAAIPILPADLRISVQ